MKPGSAFDPASLRTLTLVGHGYTRAPLEELEILERQDLHPRSSLFARSLRSDLLDSRYLDQVPEARRNLYRRIPPPLAQVAEAFLQRNRYDAVLSWAEHLGIPFAGLLKATGQRVPHVGIWSWISRPKKARAIRMIQSHVDRIVLMSGRQRAFALDELRLPPRKVVTARWPVDQKFFRPTNGPTDMICSVGREMRDYGALIEALRDTPVRCHIAANVVAGKKDSWVDAVERAGALPAHVTIGPKSFAELRDLYARSRFLVMPLLETETDNGTTSMLEAMAMGKAVISSKTEGLTESFVEGKTGLLVPVGDVRALRDAIIHLWERPDEAERMGREGRRIIEQHHALDDFVEAVRHTTLDAVDEHRRRPGTVSAREAFHAGA
jgi:glycosyltransferase involved in cell wall biosynthesis